MKQPVESGFDDIGCTEDDGVKRYSETEGINNPLDLSLTYTKLLDRLDVQCERASAVEACTLWTTCCIYVMKITVQVCFLPTGFD